MTTLKPVLLPVIAALAILGIIFPETAAAPDEGMWPFHDLPLKTLKEKYGFEPTREWLEHVQMASLKVSSGGSGSFVSADGLVATNHHVALEFINKLSTGERNLVEDGFLAKTHEEELKCPDATVKQLMSVEDVTAQVMASAKEGLPDALAAAARQQATMRMQAEESRKTGLDCEVVSMHGGSQYFMYRYKTYDDVRLVFAPEKQIAYFGGDRDNFCYPRFCLDASFLRVYVDGKPAKVEHYLKWSHQGVSEKDLIFISGNPASTGRYETMAQLKFKRDARFPTVLQLIRDRERALTAYGQGSKERMLEVLDEVFGLRNSDKAITGNNKALNDGAIWGELAQREMKFKKAVGEDPDTLKAYKSLEEASATMSRTFPLLVAQRLDGALGNLAFEVVRAVTGIDAGQDDAIKSAVKKLSGQELNPDLEEARLRASLQTAAAVLGPDDPFVKAALQGRTPEEAAKALVAGHKLTDASFLEKLIKSGSDGLKSCDEPLIKLAMIRNEARGSVMGDYQMANAATDGALTTIAKARFRVHGKDLYPDATFTLRLSFGEVRGYELGTTDIPWKTNLWGLYARNSSFDDTFPYNLPERWLEARSKLSMDTPVNFVSTADTTGGNSGSPVIDRKGEIVGLLFDGNIQSLLVDNLYEERVCRSICVDTRFIGHALKTVYGAEALAKELGVK